MMKIYGLKTIFFLSLFFVFVFIRMFEKPYFTNILERKRIFLVLFVFVEY